MQTHACSLADLTDDQLLAVVKAHAADERHATAQLIASLAELDARRLYLGQGCASLFAYCTRCLHLSRDAAYGRIAAARAAAQWPAVLGMLRDGSITLTTVCLLRKHLTEENHRALLEAARFKTREEVECQVAALRPLPDVPSCVRKLPAGAPRLNATAERPNHEPPLLVAAPLAGPTPSCEIAAPPVPTHTPAAIAPRVATVIAPLTPERYKVQITVSRECRDKLRRVQDLLRHSIPDGDAAAIFDRALTLLLNDLEKKKLARTERPRASTTPSTRSRHIPAAVRRAVWTRDEGRCAFVGPEGRCPERGFLEFHHVVPFAEKGATSVENLTLYCRAHNAYEAEGWFGPLFAET